MSRFILIIMAAFTVNASVSAQALNQQTTYLDAAQLSVIYAQYKAGNSTASSLKTDFYTILSKYGITAQNINGNPFFAGHTLELIQRAQDVNDAADFSSQEPAPSAAVSGNWQGIVINALATFMANRFKDEAMHMAINELFSKITTQDQVIIKSMFPATFAEILKLYDGGKGNYYSADLLYLRQLIQNDLDNLPANLAKNPEIIFPKLAEHPQLEDILTIVNTVLTSAKRGQPLPDIIQQLSVQPYKTAQIGQALQVAGLLSQALRNADGSTELWVSPLSLSPLQLNAPDCKVRFFYGLLYSQLTDANAVAVIKPVATYIAILNGNADKIANLLSPLLSFITQANNAYDLAKAGNFQFKNIDDAFQSVKSSVGALQQLLGSAPVNTFFVIDPKVSTAVDQVLDITGLFLDKEYERAVPVLIADLGDYLPDGATQQYTRDIAFITQLVSIQNEKDFENMLDAYALPIGSSSIKRNSDFNVSVNGYVGFTVGSEKAYGSKASQSKANMGLTAPIGVSFTWGGGFTAFVSILDLGSIVNARLGNDTSNFSSLKLEQFFSPGLGLYYNIHGLPLTLGAHYSYIPDLRTITYTSQNATVTDTHASVTRFNISVLIDIPLITLFNKTPK